MKITGVFLSGFEPAEQSTRFAKLTAPTGGKYTSSSENKVILSWNAAPTPNAMNTAYLKEHFNKYYGSYASKYYENYINDSTNMFGEFGYDVYKINSDGVATFMGWTKDVTYDLGVQPSGLYKYSIRSSYSNFKANQSDGLIINVAINPPSSEEDEETNPSTPSTPSNPSNPGDSTKPNKPNKP